MKCDELKQLVFSIADLAYVDEIRVTKNFQDPHDHAVYKATEVDAAIAELKKKLAAAQQALQLNKTEALYSGLETMGRLSHEKDVVARRLRHQKYKRCLAMAKWCECKRIDSADDRIPREKWDFYGKWHKCWIAIANKFKEVK